MFCRTRLATQTDMALLTEGELGIAVHLWAS